MSRKVALVGHCGPDGAYLRISIHKADRDVQIIVCHDGADLVAAIEQGVDLVLFNRELGLDYAAGTGVEMIQKLHETHPLLKMMLVSNYPEAQAAAVQAGGLPGFGKRELGSQRVIDLLQSALAVNA